MSRDFTPEEHFLADYSLKNAIRNSVITWTAPVGEEMRIDNHLARDRYPELSFLYERFDPYTSNMLIMTKCLHCLISLRRH